MAKSKIIKDIISNEISMSDALFRLEIICTELNNTAILSWINNEMIIYFLLAFFLKKVYIIVL